LHTQLHKSNHENKILKARAQDAEAKLLAVFEWIKMNLSEDEGEPVPLPPLASNSTNGAVNGDTLKHAAVNGTKQDLGNSSGSNGSNSSDFGPLPPPQASHVASINTFNASRMRRGDLQSQFQNWYQGSIAGHRGQMLYEEDPSGLAEDDDVF